MASAARKRSLASPTPSTQAGNGKRGRFVPTSLAAAGAEGSGEGTSVASPSRYTLRTRPSSAASSSAVKVEDAVGAGEEVPLAEDKVGAGKDPFAVSPRKKTAKPIKLELDASEARAAPKRWKEQYGVLAKQRLRIVAPVDTMGCQENGKEEKREDISRVTESAEDRARRERFTILVSLMLSSQTKDPVTAEAVHNLQRSLPGGLSLASILTASQDEISSSICKVGFWRRKTGYIQSAARIVRDDFGGDIPKTIDELCSLPGVGPKMGFLALQSAWGLNMGIGVDVHVHRVANRLKWVNSNDPEGTRLQLQSWLPKEVRSAVHFGGARCSLLTCRLPRSDAPHDQQNPRRIRPGDLPARWTTLRVSGCGPHLLAGAWSISDSCVLSTVCVHWVRLACARRIARWIQSRLLPASRSSFYQRLGRDKSTVQSK